MNDRTSDLPPTPTRRQTIAWFAAAACSPMALALPGGAATAAATVGWPAITLSRIAASGYGPDPDLAAKTVTWPLSLDPAQRQMIRLCADIILPPAPGGKAPSALGIDAFIDEWVSAPYQRQSADRALIVPGLAWLDAEATQRSGQAFAAITDPQRRTIFDTIAWQDRVTPEYAQAAAFFASLRALVVLGYYTTPEGETELGYIGNTPSQGVYPGPGPEPLAHLGKQLAALGLSMPKTAGVA